MSDELTKAQKLDLLKGIYIAQSALELGGRSSGGKDVPQSFVDAQEALSEVYDELRGDSDVLTDSDWEQFEYLSNIDFQVHDGKFLRFEVCSRN